MLFLRYSLLLVSLFALVQNMICNKGETMCLGSLMRICSSDGYWTETDCPKDTMCFKDSNSIACSKDTSETKISNGELDESNKPESFVLEIELGELKTKKGEKSKASKKNKKNDEDSNPIENLSAVILKQVLDINDESEIKNKEKSSETAAKKSNKKPQILEDDDESNRIKCSEPRNKKASKKMDDSSSENEYSDKNEKKKKKKPEKTIKKVKTENDSETNESDDKAKKKSKEAKKSRKSESTIKTKTKKKHKKMDESEDETSTSRGKGKKIDTDSDSNKKSKASGNLKMKVDSESKDESPKRKHKDTDGSNSDSTSIGKLSKKQKPETGKSKKISSNKTEPTEFESESTTENNIPKVKLKNKSIKPELETRNSGIQQRSQPISRIESDLESTNSGIQDFNPKLLNQNEKIKTKKSKAPRKINLEFEQKNKEGKVESFSVILEKSDKDNSYRGIEPSAMHKENEDNQSTPNDTMVLTQGAGNSNGKINTPMDDNGNGNEANNVSPQTNDSDSNDSNIQTGTVNNPNQSTDSNNNQNNNAQGSISTKTSNSKKNNNNSGSSKQTNKNTNNKTNSSKQTNSQTKNNKQTSSQTKNNKQTNSSKQPTKSTNKSKTNPAKSVVPQKSSSAMNNSKKNVSSAKSKSSSASKSSSSTGKLNITADKIKSALKTVNYTPNESYLSEVVSQTNENFTDLNMATMFLAQLAHESGGFVYVEEIACAGKDCTSQYGTGAPGKSYHGRGFIQLSWSANYKSAGSGIGVGDDLYNDPDQVATSIETGMKVSVWFWKNKVETVSGVSDGTQFGLTTKAINGALECRGSNEDQSKKRYTIYKAMCTEFGVTNPAAESGCYS